MLPPSLGLHARSTHVFWRHCLAGFVESLRAVFLRVPYGCCFRFIAAVLLLLSLSSPLFLCVVVLLVILLLLSLLLFYYYCYREYYYYYHHHWEVCRRCNTNYVKINWIRQFMICYLQITCHCRYWEFLSLPRMLLLIGCDIFGSINVIVRIFIVLLIISMCCEHYSFAISICLKFNQNSSRKRWKERETGREGERKRERKKTDWQTDRKAFGEKRRAHPPFWQQCLANLWRVSSPGWQQRPGERMEILIGSFSPPPPPLKRITSN